MCSIPQAAELDALSVAELQAAVLAAQSAVERATAVRDTVLAALDGRCAGVVPVGRMDAAEPLLVPTSAWLRGQTMLGPVESGRIVREAATAAAAPVAVQAVVDGVLHVAHARIIGNALAGLAVDNPDLAAAAEPIWVDYAKEAEPELLRRRI